MAAKPLILSPNYLTVVRGIREMHRLIAAGQEDSPAAEALGMLSTVLGRYSLKWNAEGPADSRKTSIQSRKAQPPAEAMNPQAAARLSDAIEARQEGEWDRALELLRRWRAHTAPALVSYLRGSIWIEAGDPHTAVLFYDHASRLQPDNGNYLASFLHTLELVDKAAAKQRAEEILRSRISSQRWPLFTLPVWNSKRRWRCWRWTQHSSTGN